MATITTEFGKLSSKKLFKALDLSIQTFLQDRCCDIADIAGLLDRTPIAYLAPIGNQQCYRLCEYIQFLRWLQLATVYSLVELISQYPNLFTLGQSLLFHVTNTNAIITLNGTKLMNEDPAKVLLSVCADGWKGAGNKATLNAVSQQLDGNILVGSDSELTLTLSDGSSFTGSISGNITNATGNTVSTETGKVDVTLDEGCTWNLTADTYITSFTGDASHFKSNGHCLYVNGKKMNIQ